jgi:putative ABC transport system permease protein
VKILLGATAILLLIACINVTNLFLSRTAVRAKEMALREALGAKRWRIIRHMLAESLALAFVGGAIGSACAVFGVRMLLRMAPPGLPRLDVVPTDSTVLLFAVGLTLLVGVIIGLAPAWRLANNSLRALVNEGGRGAVGGPGWTRVFSSLVVAEIALAVLLAIGAGLLVRSYFNMIKTDPGFNPERVLTFFMNVPGRSEISYKQNDKGQFEVTGSYAPMANFFRELLERIKGVPGVKYVATTNNLPLARYQYGRSTLFNLPDQPGMNSKTLAQSAVAESVSPDFYRTLSIRLLAGRKFLSSDRPGSPGVAVVNETFVRRFLSGQNPLGQRIRLPENPFVPTDIGFQFAQRTVNDLEIVGVVENVKYQTLGDPPEPRIYMSCEQWITRHRTIVVIASIKNPESLAVPIMNKITSMDRLLSAEFTMYPSIVQASLARERLATVLLVIFGLVALVLAAVGTYGLMSFSVAQRTSEIAVRSAMGASASQVMTLVIGQGVKLALCGIILGVIGSAALRQVIASQLYGVTALDGRVYALVSAVLFAVALLACFLPAQRAIRINPADLLRSE